MRLCFHNTIVFKLLQKIPTDAFARLMQFATRLLSPAMHYAQPVSVELRLAYDSRMTAPRSRFNCSTSFSCAAFTSASVKVRSALRYVNA
jgi:hypothetical protein